MDAFLDRHRAALLDKHRWALTQSAKCQPKPAAPAGSEQKGQWVSFRVARNTAKIALPLPVVSVIA